MDSIKELIDICFKADGFEKDKYMKNYLEKLNELKSLKGESHENRILQIKRSFITVYERFPEIAKANFSFLEHENVKINMKDYGQTYIPISNIYKQYLFEKDELAPTYIQYYLVDILVRLCEKEELSSVLSSFKIDVIKTNKSDTEKISETFKMGLEEIMTSNPGEKDTQKMVNIAINNKNFNDTMNMMSQVLQKNPDSLPELAGSMLRQLAKKK